MTVLRFELVVVGQDEEARVAFRRLYFPIPAELTDLLFPTASVHLVQRHLLQNALAVPRYSARLEDGILLNQLADPVDEGAHLCREVTALRIHYRDG